MYRSAAIVFLALVSTTPAAEPSIRLKISAGPVDRLNTPVVVPLRTTKSTAVALRLPDGTRIPAQWTGPSLLSPNTRDGDRELHFILPKLKAGETLTATLASGASATGEHFDWQDHKGEFVDLQFGTRPVLRYMYQGLDDSSKEKRELTYKVFHHLYDPSGQRLVTKGPGGLYPHHRGLYYGFNRISYDNGKKKADVWHCTGDASQTHEAFLAKETGPVFGRHRVAILWHGPGKEVFAREERELTVYNIPGGQLVEFASRLTSTVGPVRLDGDPQHAGFQFRADNEVAAKTAKQTYYVRPDGVGQPGATRNWDPKNKGPVNLPWNAMSFVLGGERFTAAYLDKPTNPKEARYSERDYGRFGSYFEFDLDKDKPLAVDYRLWLQKGEMTVADVTKLSNDFVKPVIATIESP
jgi:hypothetical protein